MEEHIEPQNQHSANQRHLLPSDYNSMREEVRRCADVLRKGGVLVYPTDTVWGIGCDATSSDAVRKIYSLKQRSDSKAMIVLVNSLEMLEQYIDTIPEVAYQLIEVAVTPMTIVYDHGIGLAPELYAPDGSIGVRYTSDPFCQALCRALRRPIVSTSANISGAATARFYSEISEKILSGADYVAEWRRDDKVTAPPSSVIKLSAGGEIKILRS